MGCCQGVGRRLQGDRWEGFGTAGGEGVGGWGQEFLYL